MVSHDLRNPLNVAQSAVALLDTDADDADLVDKIDRSLTRMTDVIEDVLTLARQGQTVDEPESVELEQLATEAWQWVETDRSELVVEGAVTFEPDPGRVQNLLSNLFRNAVEHNDNPVTITVGVLDDGFYVADDGAGFEITGVEPAD